MTSRALALSIVAAVGLSGCFRTTVYSGLPPGDPPESHDERWHSGWLGGAIEASGPHDLAAACPNGWAQIETRTDASQGLVTLITLGIYAPQSVTIVCAAPHSSKTISPPPAKGF